MKQSKQFLIFGLLACVILGVLVSSPTIYAIVEPHITITMDPGQTTKPLVINDDTGTEVFSVDVDGTISPSGATIGTGDITSFEFFQKTPVTFFADRDNPFVFAKWTLTWNLDAGTPKITLTKNMDIVSGEIRGLDVGGSGASATGSLGLNRPTITNLGSGYLPNISIPITITGGGGSGGAAEAFADNFGQLSFIRILDSGSGYTSLPTITIESAPPSGTTATAVAKLGVVDLIISNGGNGYNSAQEVTFTGGGGSGAFGTTVISGPGGSVIGYRFSSTQSGQGDGYTSPPTAVFGDATGGVFAEIRTVEGTFVDEWSSIGGGSGTFVNLHSNSFPSSIGFITTEQTMDIEFIGYHSQVTRVGELRNTYWQFEMRVPDFVTVERIQ